MVILDFSGNPSSKSAFHFLHKIGKGKKLAAVFRLFPSMQSKLNIHPKFFEASNVTFQLEKLSISQLASTTKLLCMHACMHQDEEDKSESMYVVCVCCCTYAASSLKVTAQPVAQLAS